MHGVTTTEAQAAAATVSSPARMIGIGITGHRPERLVGRDLDGLHAQVADTLDAIARAADRGGPTSIRLISALAEGADSIVADAALERGWTLDAVLPFARKDYAKDFAAGETRDTHRDRLDRATAIYELLGDRSDDDSAAAAYERAGRVVLAQTDLLIAVWDGGPVRGRGGAAQIVAEAVLKGIPVLRIDPTGGEHPTLLWDGLAEVDLGQQTIETVARGDISRLGDVIGDLIDAPGDAAEAAMIARFGRSTTRWPVAAGIAYPLLLGVAGVRRPRVADVGLARRVTTASSPLAACAGAPTFAARLASVIADRFAVADVAATRAAALFRSGYVMNFSLSALAVVLTMLGLALPSAFKPWLITAELATIATILLITLAGNHSRWHRLWLDNRALAERMRGLALSTQLADLDLRNSGEQTAPWVAWYTRACARGAGLPSVRADDAYLGCVRSELIGVIDAQIAYLDTDARRMHHLDHRLHLAGTFLFMVTALGCLVLLVSKLLHEWMPAIAAIQGPLTTTVTIISAALPAVGAAIYGIRMQGDFASVASRSEALGHDLAVLRAIIEKDDLGFDTLLRRTRRLTDLLSVDLSAWLQTYHARPLTLPG